MNILWQSDFMIPTGFGQQAEYIVNALHEAGHEINVLAWQHRVKPIEHEGIRIFPTQHAQWGKTQYARKLEHFNPDLVITLADLWQVRYMCNVPREAPWIAITPVDTEPLPPGFTDICYWIDHLVCYSQFAKHQLDTQTPNPIGNVYIPHGVDLDLFKPPTDEQKVQYKRLLGFSEDTIVIGFVGRINPRKQLDRTLRIFELVEKQVEDDKELILFLHSDLNDPMKREQRDLRNLVDLLDLERKVAASEINWNEGIPLDQMRYIYGAMDIYLTTTAGEGFGVPLIEAQACGVPCVATNFTTPPELIQDHGELIEVERFVRENGVKRARCSIEDGVHKVLKLIEDEDLRKRYSEQSVEFVRQHYDINKITDAWVQFIDTLEMDFQDAHIEEIYEETPAVQQLKKEIMARARTTTS